MVEATQSLGQAREHIDALDDRIHDLIMERAALVQSVIRAKADDGRPPYRPGREARVLRRLAGRHHGPFPLLPLIHVWRQIIPASLGLQGGFAVAVYAGEGAGDRRDVARDHFGAATPIMPHQTHAGVVNAVTEGSAAAGILPLPSDGREESWWPRLLHAGSPSIVARLPFAPLPAQSAETDEALVIAMTRPETSDDDRSFVALRSGAASSRARIGDAFKTRSLEPTMMLSQDDSADAEVSLFLVEIEAFIEPDDPRIASLLADLDGPAPAIWVLGGYARPFTRAELGGGQGARAAARS